MIFGQNREKTPNSLFVKGFACDFNGHFMLFCYLCVKTLKYAVWAILGMMRWFWECCYFPLEILMIIRIQPLNFFIGYGDSLRIRSIFANLQFSAEKATKM